MASITNPHNGLDMQFCVALLPDDETCWPFYIGRATEFLTGHGRPTTDPLELAINAGMIWMHDQHVIMPPWLLALVHKSATERYGARA